MGEESQIEHFGFSAERVSLERRHFIRKILSNAFDAVLEKINCSQETMVLLIQKKEVVVQTIWNSINKMVKEVDDLDKKYFNVPNHVLLPHDFENEKIFSKFDEEKIDSQLQKQKQVFLENSVMLASLEMENERYRKFAKFVEDEICLQRQVQECLNAWNMKEVLKLVQKAHSYRL